MTIMVRLSAYKECRQAMSGLQDSRLHRCVQPSLGLLAWACLLPGRGRLKPG